ncbi:hypothetical protein M0R45_016755 [Rubus argutus]|uniref:Uncharacterized protein n=1 Tax=Rubus argutus TaxID=59490 RepID=A0AAW1XVZ1_RUBAR
MMFHSALLDSNKSSEVKGNTSSRPFRAGVDDSIAVSVVQVFKEFTCSNQDIDESPQLVKVKEEPVELEDEVHPQPIWFIQELFDLIEMDTMRDVISLNDNDKCRFIVHDRVEFNIVCFNHFNNVGRFKQYEHTLRNLGFKKDIMEFWYKDKMLCKNRPLLLPRIKEEPSTMVSFTA